MTAYKNLQVDIASKIAKGQASVISVFATDSPQENDFAYTVGLTSLGLPEIIIVGSMDPLIQHVLIGSLTAKYKERGAFFGVSNELLQNGLRVDLVEVDCTAPKTKEFIVQALGYYGSDVGKVRLVQIRWPDAQGRLPDEPGFDMGDKQDLLPRLNH